MFASLYLLLGKKYRYPLQSSAIGQISAPIANRQHTYICSLLQILLADKNGIIPASFTNTSALYNGSRLKGATNYDDKRATKRHTCSSSYVLISCNDNRYILDTPAETILYESPNNRYC